MLSNCFHCDLPNPKNSAFYCELLGDSRQFCCAGCLAIAETLKDNQLLEFYRFRANRSNKAEPIIPQELLDLEALDQPTIIDEISTTEQSTRKIELGIEGITCAACGWLIEKKLQQLPQVQSISVNVSTQRATLVWQNSSPLSAILKSLINLGYRAYPFSEDSRQASFEKTNQLYIKRLLLAALGMMQVMSYALAIYIGEFQDLSAANQRFFYWISGLITTPVVFYSAKPFFQSAYRNLKAKQLGMNLPVSIAILSAYFASVYSLLSGGKLYYFDSVVMFVFFLLIGRFLEHRARFRSLQKQQNFKRLLPLSVSRRHADNHIEVISTSKIKSGDIVMINAGAIIPVDGLLLERSAEVNEAILTGEFMPIKKEAGDSLISGSTNQSAALVMQVKKNLEQSHIQQLISIQQGAEQLKPDSVSLADKIAHWYVFILLILVVFSSFLWWFIQPSMIFPIVLSVLVVSCPCALSLATPAVIAAATSQLSDLGLMIRSKNAISRLSKVEHIYFDKTGTLTTGTMQLSHLQIYSSVDEKNCIEIAFALEQISDHPIAKAFSNVCSEQMNSISVDQPRETISEGVSGVIDGRLYRLGKKDFALTDCLESIEQTDSCPRENETALFLTVENTLLATFYFEDGLKPSAISAIKKLHKMGKTISILSGDSKTAVSKVAAQLGIKRYFANQNPSSKLDRIVNHQKTDRNVLMVGDGFNDVGALAAANVSITMGTACNVSKTASDAVLVSDNLVIIAEVLTIAKKVQRVIRQNLIWAVAYNVTAIPFAMMGLVPAWLAALGMSFSSLVVVLNALRLRK